MVTLGSKKKEEEELNTYDEEEIELIKKENELMEEMSIIAEKHRNVDIVYDRIQANLKKILKKYEKKEKDDKLNTDETNKEEKSENDEKEKENEKEKEEKVDSDGLKRHELIDKYDEVLKENIIRLNKILESNDKEKFEKMVKEKSSISPSAKKKKSDAKITQLSNNLKQRPVGKLEEYNYHDEENNEEDKKIQEHVIAMTRIYWEEEKRMKENAEKEEAERKKK